MSGPGGSVLVVDVGTSGVRAAVVRPDATVAHAHYAPVLPDSPAPGLVEFDAALMADAVLGVAQAALKDSGPVAAVGIADQRASTIVWDRTTGQPLAPGIGWQDLRTVGTCLVLQAEGIRLAPNASATKLMAILDAVDPDRVRAEAGELCFGTVDSWVAWILSGGAQAGRDALHVTDATNAAVTGLVDPATITWDEPLLERLRIPNALLPRIVDSSGAIGPSHALAGAPVICGIAGDQQASLVGQGCTRPGLAKATFGTGGMLDQCTGVGRPPQHAGRGDGGTFPIVAYRVGGVATWGVEAVMLSAGSCVEWLRDDLGLLASAEESAAVAAECETTGDVWFVPALLGLGTPVWDFGARGTLVGLTRGSGRPELVRAVLEGIAHRGADLVEAAETDSGYGIAALRIDGGMSDNEVFVTALADAIGRPVEVSPVLEATTLGAGLLAGLAIGTYTSTDEIAATFSPRRTVEPRTDDATRTQRRERWLAARGKAEATIPELSGISF
ncbi:MAG TPA: FGGY family carbohydrate kinase [Acidimicrobiales bacterium]|jgi:glycerol kinase|nr:FGGY family carbohydrate kinase [Acidimicrobiales bacterium]